jgi:uncharacterized membrane protein YfcA
VSASTIAIALAVGIGSGAVSGMLGVGGGVLMVPAMVVFLGMTQHAAEGTSLLVIIPTAVVGAYTHWRHGYVMLGTAAVLGIAGILGALAGSHIALAVPSHTLRILFVIYLIIMGVRMIFPTRRRSSQAART